MKIISEQLFVKHYYTKDIQLKVMHGPLEKTVKDVISIDTQDNHYFAFQLKGWKY